MAMHAEPFRDDMPGADGIVLEVAPVVPSTGPRYEIRSGRERRASGGRSKAPPRASRRRSADAAP
ncbi:MAG: hypothetical protein ACYC8T_32300 [Myxococcaceae bacterium]